VRGVVLDLAEQSTMLCRYLCRVEHGDSRADKELSTFFHDSEVNMNSSCSTFGLRPKQAVDVFAGAQS
jgi:hypothetical protein